MIPRSGALALVPGASVPISLDGPGAWPRCISRRTSSTTARSALKVLRPELAAVLGAERSVQQIKTTASLQHPHILPLFDSGAPRPLFPVPQYRSARNRQQYAVAPDDRHFVMIRELSGEAGGGVVYVEHWFAELQATVKR